MNETWVSSDSDKILKISKNFGASILKRPLKLSGDNATSETALLHFANSVDFDILVFIQCTAPLIKSKDINQGIKNEKVWLSGVNFWNKSNVLGWEWTIIQYQNSNENKGYLETGISPQKNLLKYKNRLSGKIGFVKFLK